MSGTTPLIDHIDPSSAQKEVIANRVNDAQAPAATLGIKTLIGLTLVVYGGPIDVAGVPTILANQTLTLTDNATNYVKLSPAGVISTVASAPTGWPGPLAAGVTALFTIVTVSGFATSITEYRIAHRTSGAAAGMIVLAPAYAATVTVDLTGYAGYPQVIVNVGTLTGPITFNITNGADGQMVRVRFTQDGTGTRILTPGANLRGSTDTPIPTLTTTASKMDRLAFEWHAGAGKADLVAYNKGY
jgi:hypothetical protein